MLLISYILLSLCDEENFFFLQSKRTDKNYAVKATEGLFYQEHMFSSIVRIGVIIVASLVLIGLLWEFAYRRRRHGTSWILIIKSIRTIYSLAILSGLLSLFNKSVRFKWHHLLTIFFSLIL